MSHFKTYLMFYYHSVSGKPSITPDNDVFQHLAQTYASLHPSMHLGTPACPNNVGKLKKCINFIWNAKIIRYKR